MGQNQLASTNVEIERTDPELKYLEFVRVISIKILVLFLCLYDYAKDRAWFFKSPVVAVENAVVYVFGPVYRMLTGVVDDVLAFADNKVEGALNKFDRYAPFLAKQLVTKILSPTLTFITKFLSKIQSMVQDFMKEAQAVGILAALKTSLIALKSIAITKLAKLWYEANKIALFHEVADQMALPIAVYFSKKYNKLVAAFVYVPMIPVDEMANAYKMVKAAKEEPSSSTTDTTAEDVTPKKMVISNYFD